MKTNIMQQIKTMVAHIEAAADTITSTRDFCGNEREAVKDYCFDNGIDFNDEFFCSAIDVANQKWAEYQMASGVMR